MTFPLKVNKTIQAIGVLFRADNVRRMNYMRLLKLLYIADRESLKETSRPITGGPVVAMERGPVLDEVYSLIKNEHTEMPLWTQFARTDRYDLELLKEPDVGQLSKYEVRKLQQIAERYKNDDEWVLVQKTHEFEEWKKNNPGTSSRRIPLADILDAVGQGPATAEIMKEARELCALNSIFGK